MNPFDPKIKIHKRDTFTRYTPLGLVTGLYFRATFGVRVSMRSYEELKNFQLGWSTKDLVQESLNRQYLSVTALHNAAPMGIPNVPCTYVLRLSQKDATSPLSIVLVIETRGKDSDEAKNNALNLWRSLQATIPYDYIIEAIAEDEYSDQVELGWLCNPDCSPEIAILVPFVGFLLDSPEGGKRPQHIPLIGNWAASPTSPELIWRTIMHSSTPLLMDIFLQPTQLLSNERRMLIESMKKLSEAASNAQGLAKLQAEQWFSSLTKRIQSMDLVYMLQIRLVSPSEISPQTIIAIGSALTADQHNEKHLDFSPFRAYHLKPPRNYAGLKSIASQKFINIPVPTYPMLQRLPFIATAQEALSAFRIPILPKGGIPDLDLGIKRNVVLNTTSA